MTEQKNLEIIKSDLAKELDDTNERIEKGKAAVLRRKQYLYEASASDMDEAEIISNMEEIDQDVAMTDMDIRRAQILTKQLDSPYFGKLKFCFDEDGDTIPVYVGINGYWSKDKEEQLVFDWRAPVCSMFYDYETGAASYHAPAGEITGQITEKKQIQIADGRLEYVLDTDTVINDEILIGALNRNSSEKMHSVVNTIQKQQNAVIRNTSAAVLVVDGRAGSGKTVIALHRVAWLLYNYRKKMKSHQVMILSPNGVFSDYISGILPELGEDAAPEKEWDDLMSEILFISEEYETRLEQADAILAADGMDAPRMKNIRYKSSIDFFEKFQAYLERYVTGLTFSDFHFEKTVFPGERTRMLFLNTFRQYPPYERFLHIAAFIVDNMEEESGKQFAGRRREQLLKQIQTEMVIRFAKRNIVEIYRSFLEELETEKTGMGTFYNDNGKICYEDILPIFYLQVYLYGCNTYQDMKHLVVDEMQDYTIFQYAVLDKIFACPKTILGDRYQVLFYDEKETVLDVLSCIFPEHELVTLEQAYRSTRQITEFCNRIIGKTDIIPFARDGKEPVVDQVKTKKTLISHLRKILRQLQPVSGGNHVAERILQYENIAILTDDEQTAGEIYMELREEFDITLVAEDSAVYFGGLVIMPKFFAKGMEFDAVCVVNQKKRGDNVVEQHEYYISCTRALHELYVLELME